MIIDGKDLIMGRLGTYISKRALLGDSIDVVNCEQIIISGARDSVFAHYKIKHDRGIPSKGPFYPRMPHLFVRRCLRGMLPYKQPKGKEALKRIKFHIGIPDEFKDKKMESLESAHKKRLGTLRTVSIYELCKYLGWKG